VKLWTKLLADAEFRALLRKHGAAAWAWAGIILLACREERPGRAGYLEGVLGPMSADDIADELGFTPGLSDGHSTGQSAGMSVVFSGLMEDLRRLEWVVIEDGCYRLPEYLNHQETPDAARKRAEREEEDAKGPDSPQDSPMDSPQECPRQEDQRDRGSEDQKKRGDTRATSSAPPDSKKKKRTPKGWESDETIAAARPEFVSPEAWDGFVDHRKANGWKLTKGALTLLVGSLKKWSGQGFRVSPLLDEATMKNWRAPADPNERFSAPAECKPNGGAGHLKPEHTPFPPMEKRKKQPPPPGWRDGLGLGGDAK
jgi:hypothetical protein